jgi:pilus assembly protein Flp/PilA
MLCASQQKGQGLAEYAFILVLVALVVIVILVLFGPAVGNMYSNVIDMVWGSKSFFYMNNKSFKKIPHCRVSAVAALHLFSPGGMTLQNT